jgi:hypothetical protein
MTGIELFNPSNALIASGLSGPEGAKTLLAAAQGFPGGPVMLVFALFWAPVGPGIPAGVLLARHVPLNPLVTFGLYAASDVLAAVVLNPVFTGLRRWARRVPSLRKAGQRFLRLAMMGTPAARPASADGAPPTRAAELFRVATIGFGVDVYTAGAVATGLPVSRVMRWACAIAGDLVWFAILLATSIAAASVADDDRVVGIVVLIAMLVIPSIARRIFPALRPPPRDPERGA